MTGTTSFRTPLREAPPRSWLFLPATRAVELLPKAASSGADALILDMEDAVPPHEKDRARDLLLEAARNARPPIPWVVRVNAAPASLLAADVASAVLAGADGIMLPKTVDPEDIRDLEVLLESNESKAGGRELFVVALIESSVGVLAAPKIAMATPRVMGLALGGEDLAVDLGVSRTRGALELLQSRAQLVLAAAAAGCFAIDTPCTDLKNPVAAGREARLARRLGFLGKLVIHPSHVPAVNAAFTPSPEELEMARAIVVTFDAAKVAGQGVVRVAGRMVDEPVAAAARRVISRAERRGEFVADTN